MLPALLLLPSLAFASLSPPEPRDSHAAIGQRLEEATVTLMPGICAGAIAGDRDHVLTAAHCIAGRETQPIPIEFANGDSAIATAEAVMRDDDLAVLRLDKPAPFDPLEVSPGLPPAGTAVFFGGRNDHPEDVLQAARVKRLAPCPSLPNIPAALHTTIRGEPGDSGSPLVDAKMRIVGLVHGGAMCSIAAPAALAAPILATLGKDGAQCLGPAAPELELGVGGAGPATSP